MIIRHIDPEEFTELGNLMVAVYSRLSGFPSQQSQPDYYQMLHRIGEFSYKPNTEVLVAVSDHGELMGGVVYFSDMKEYGSGGTATAEKNSSGIRLLAVSPKAQGKGVGKALTLACLEKARGSGNRQFVLHTTEAMQIAWKMYQQLGFQRALDLDFLQGELPVYGFRLKL